MKSIILDSKNYSNINYILPYIRYSNDDIYTSLWTLKKRRISDYEFIYVTKGSCNFTICNKSYILKEGDLLLIEPGVYHKAKSLIHPFNFYCVHFDIFSSDSFNASTLNSNMSFESIPNKAIDYTKCTLDFPTHISVVDPLSIKEYFRKIIKEQKNKKPGYTLIIKSLLSELLYTLFRQISNHNTKKVADSNILSIISFIESNYMKKISLKNISEYIHLHPTYISSFFKKHQGITISEYIRMYRIATAKKYLMETDKTIENIALITGFYDIHHFSKIFKKQEGISPSQYREIKI